MPRGWWFPVVVVCLVVAVIRVIDVRTDIGDFFFPGKHDDFNFMLGQLQSDQLSRRYILDIIPASTGDQIAPAFIEELKRQLELIDEINKVWSKQLAAGQLDRLLQEYAPHQVHLYSLQPEIEIQKLIEPGSLHRQAKKIKDALLGPDPQLVKSVVRNDPMLLTLHWLERLGRASETAVDSIGHAAIFIETHSSGLDTESQETFQIALEQSFAALNSQFNNKYQMEYTGVPVFSVTIKSQIVSDIQRVSILSTLVLTLLAWLVFRSWRTLLCMSLLLLATAGFATLLTQAVFGQIHGLTLALGTTLIGICIDYFIHSMVHAGDESSLERTRAIQKIWPTLITGGATTLIGYVALSMSGFPGLQQIAFFTGSGIVAALLMCRFVLPDLMGLFRVKSVPNINSLAILRITGRPSVRIWSLSLVALCIASGLSQLQWDDDLNTLTPSLQNLKERDQRIRSQLNNVEAGRFILINAKSVEEALVTGEMLQPLLEDLQRNEDLEAFFPLHPWIASRRLQNKNAQIWDEVWTEQAQREWRLALQEQGLKSTAFSSLDKSEDGLLDISQLNFPPVAEIISRQLLQRDDGVSLAIWLGPHDPEKIRAVLRAVPHANYFSHKDSIKKLATEYRERGQPMLLGGLVLILLVLTVRYRSVKNGLTALAPAILSVTAVLGLWGLSGVPLGILHLVGLLLTAAICVDYGIFFLENRSENIIRTFQAITVSAITTSASFACLGVAQSPALHALAWTVAPGVLLGFILCPVLLQRASEKGLTEN